MESTEFTVEQAAERMEGLLSAENGTQEPEEAAAEESAEVEPESEAEGEPAEESEESDEAEQEEEPEEEPSYTVKIDGKDAKVPLKELLSGYQRNADYTRKTQQLAEERRELEAVKAEREHYSEALSQVKALLEQARPKEHDWDKLIQENPIEAYRLKLQHDRHQEQLRAVEAEQAKVRAAQEADEQKAQAEYVAQEEKKLLEAIPEWSKNPKQARSEKAAMVEFAAKLGYSPEEIGAVADHRAVLLLYKAMKLDQMQAKQAAIRPTAAQPSVKPARGGNAPQKAQMNAAQAMKRLKQSGDVDDAAAWLLHSGVLN